MTEQPEKTESEQPEDVEDIGRATVETEKDPAKETVSDRLAIETLLRQARAATRAALIAEVAVWFLAGVVGYLFFAFGLALVIPKHAETVIAATLAVGAVVAVGALVSIVFLIYQTFPSLYDIASRLQSATPEFRSDIVAALQFSEPDANLTHVSEPLARAHVAKTARMLVDTKQNVENLAFLLPTRPLMPALIALIAGGVLCSGLYLLRGPDIDKLVESLWEKLEPSAKTEKAARSIVGEIDIHYQFPPYANRAPTYEAFTTGHIKALVGTEVTLKTYPLLEARSFELMWKSGDDVRSIELDSTGDRRLETTVNLTKPGTYTFRAIAHDGTVLEDPMTRSVEVEPDRAPEIVINSHHGEVEVSPTEQLTIEFTASDDFGIETVNSSTHFAQDEQNATRTALDLPSLLNIPRSIDGTTIIDLAPLNLQPKDVVIFTIEASDNNSMTGPGIGKSAPLVLRVTSPADKHQRLIHAQQEVLDSLIDVLGSFLESPMGERVVEKKKDRQRIKNFEPAVLKPRLEKLSQAHDEEAIVLQVMQALAKELEDDPLLLKRDFQTFKGIYERLYRDHRNGAEVFSRAKPKLENNRLTDRGAQKVADYATNHELLLEGIVLALEDVLRLQKVDAIEDTAKEIREIRDRIKELLEKYKESGDPEIKKAILREIQRLRQRMNELMSRMQKQMQNLPQEHLNMDAIDQAEMANKANDIGSDLQNIEDMLKNDDVDGALAALEKLSENLDDMTKNMHGKEGGPQSNGGPSALDKELNELMDQLNDIESSQRKLEQETREIQLKDEQQRDQQIKDLLNKGLNEIEKLVEVQQEQVAEMQKRKLARHDARSVDGAEQRLQQLKDALKQKDIEQALERSRELEQDLKSLEFGMELSERYARDKKALQRDIRSSRKDLQKMVPRSKNISKNLREIIDKAGQSGKIDNGKVNELRKRQQGVEQRTEKLQKKIRESAQKFPMLDGEMGESIQKAKQDMGKSEGGLKKSRVQRSLDFQRSALENLQNVKQSMKNALEKERMGDKEKNKEKVAIPTKDSRDSLDIREEVQKRMKDERLENYDSEIERYYKSLTE